jgi:hypothetical protein
MGCHPTIETMLTVRGRNVVAGAHIAVA